MIIQRLLIILFFLNGIISLSNGQIITLAMEDNTPQGFIVHDIVYDVNGKPLGYITKSKYISRQMVLFSFNGDEIALYEGEGLLYSLEGDLISVKYVGPELMKPKFQSIPIKKPRRESWKPSDDPVGYELWKFNRRTEKAKQESS